MKRTPKWHHKVKWLLESFCLSITSSCWMRPQSFIYITYHILDSQAMREEPSGILCHCRPIPCPAADFPWCRVNNHISSTAMKRKTPPLGWGKGSTVECKHLWIAGLNHSCIWITQCKLVPNSHIDRMFFLLKTLLLTPERDISKPHDYLCLHIMGHCQHAGRDFNNGPLANYVLASPLGQFESNFTHKNVFMRSFHGI